jgi:DNA-binding response OmpR family regulator
MAERILVINDTQEILDLFREILEGEGFEVLLYSYAIRDIAEIERLKPDLIIVDFFFSAQKEGWQMVQKLKLHRSMASLPIIVCTAAEQAVREIEGYLQAKGIALLPKPFDIDDLLQAVEEALRSRKSSAAMVDDKTHHTKEKDQ